MERHGYPEETYYTFSYSPVPDDDGGTGGILCANTDDTQRIIGERQLALLRELAARTADARTIEEACARSAAQPGNQPARPAVRADLPGRCRRAARCCWPAPAGIDTGHPAAPETVALDERLASGRSRGAAHATTPCWSPTSPQSLGDAAGGRLGPAAAPGGGRADRALRADRHGRRPGRRPESATGCSTTATGVSSTWSPARSPPPSPTPRPTRRSGGGPRRWPSSTAPRPPSSPTSATSSAPRSR